jgi:hypothetical protein
MRRYEMKRLKRLDFSAGQEIHPPEAALNINGAISGL